MTLGIGVTSVFQQLGEAIYGAGKALVLFGTTRAGDAMLEIRDRFRTIRENVEADLAKIEALWSDSPINPQNAKAAAAPQIDAPNIEALKQASKGADDFAKAAKDAQELADKNAEALAGYNAQILELTGRTAEAAAATFELANAQARLDFEAEGNVAGLAAIERMRELAAAQERFNVLQVESERITADLQTAEERIQRTQETGAINELDALGRIDAARAGVLDRLRAIADAQAEIGRSTGNLEMQRQAEAAAKAIEQLESQTDLLGQSIKANIEDSFASAFERFLSGAESAKDAFKSLMSSIAADVASFVAKDMARRLLASIMPTGGGAGGGIGGFLAGIFGGARDSGGRGSPGRAYLIGTGAQPEMFVPDSPGRFFPADDFAMAAAGGGGGMTIVNNFTVSAPGGVVTRRTEAQIAAAASRGLASANMRGN
jgi:hypothetical protein